MPPVPDHSVRDTTPPRLRIARSLVHLVPPVTCANQRGGTPCHGRFLTLPSSEGLVGNAERNWPPLAADTAERRFPWRILPALPASDSRTVAGCDAKQAP